MPQKANKPVNERIKFNKGIEADEVKVMDWGCDVCLRLCAGRSPELSPGRCEDGGGEVSVGSANFLW